MGRANKTKNLAILFKYKPRFDHSGEWFNDISWTSCWTEIDCCTELPTNIYIDKIITDMIPTE